MLPFVNKPTYNKWINMGAINWKFIIRPLGIASLLSIVSGVAFLFYPALISSFAYLLVWAHAEWDWWRKGETKGDIEKIKNFFK